MQQIKVKFSVDIYVEKDGKEYHAFCPVLKGLHVDGKTQKEALYNVKKAVKLHIKSLLKHKDAIPLGIITTAEIRSSQRSNIYRKHFSTSLAVPVECRA